MPTSASPRLMARDRLDGWADDIADLMRRNLTDPAEHASLTEVVECLRGPATVTDVMSAQFFVLRASQRERTHLLGRHRLSNMAIAMLVDAGQAEAS